MADIAALKKAQQRALDKYQTSTAILKSPTADIATAAQSANDSWLEYKRLSVEIQSCSIVKKMEDSFGC